MSVNELFCENLLQYFSSFSDLKDLRSTYVANCVFNNFLTYSTIMLNIVTIFAIRKTSTLPKTLKTLLLSLAVSDVGVGLFVQPFYTSLLVNWLQQNNPSCYTYRIFQIFANLFSVASFLGVVAVSVDRFLVVHLHLRYQELVTHKRVVVVVILVWVLSVTVPCLSLGNLHDTHRLTLLIGAVICLLLTTAFYIRIYFVARRHKNHIQTLLLQQGEHTGEIANLLASLILQSVYFMCILCF